MQRLIIDINNIENANILISLLNKVDFIEKIETVKGIIKKPFKDNIGDWEEIIGSLQARDEDKNKGWKELRDEMHEERHEKYL